MIDPISLLDHRTEMSQNLFDFHPWLNYKNNDCLGNVDIDPFNIYYLQNQTTGRFSLSYH